MKLLILCLCFIVASNAYAQDSTFNHRKDSIGGLPVKQAPDSDSISSKEITEIKHSSKDTIPQLFSQQPKDSIAEKTTADTGFIRKDTLKNSFVQQNSGDTTASLKRMDSSAKIKGDIPVIAGSNKKDTLYQKTAVDSIPAKDTIPDIFTKNPPVQKDLPSASSTRTREDVDHLFTPKSATQAYTFRQLFIPNKKFEKNTSIETETDLSVLQQNVSYKTKADFNTEYFLKDTVGQQFLFDVSVTKLNTEVETMGVQLQYNSEQKQDSTSTFAKPLYDIVGKHAQLIVDSNDVITQTDTTEMGKKIRSVLGSLSLSSGGDAEVGNNFSLLINKPLSGLKIGDAWKDSAVNGSNKRVNRYEVQNILRNDIIVLLTGSVEQTGAIQSDGHTFKTKFSGTQTGKMKIDASSGLIKSKNIIFTMKGTVEFEGKDIPASAISKINEAVTVP